MSTYLITGALLACLAGGTIYVIVVHESSHIEEQRHRDEDDAGRRFFNHQDRPESGNKREPF